MLALSMDKLKQLRILRVGGHPWQSDGGRQCRGRGPRHHGPPAGRAGRAPGREAADAHHPAHHAHARGQCVSGRLPAPARRTWPMQRPASAPVASRPAGRLRITAPAGFGRRHVAPLVPKFRELHPRCTISLNLSDRVVDIAGEGLELRRAAWATCPIRPWSACAWPTTAACAWPHRPI